MYEDKIINVVCARKLQKKIKILPYNIIVYVSHALSKWHLFYPSGKFVAVEKKRQSYTSISYMILHKVY